MDSAQTGSLNPAELVAERICHDLAGLAGTLTGALDMAADDTEPSDALALALDISASLNARLRLLRAAFGGGCGEITAQSIAELAPGLPGAERITIACDGLSGGLDEAHGRALWLLLLLAATAMPRGGRIEISGTQAALGLRVIATGSTWPAGVFARCGTELTPRAFPAWLLHHHAGAHQIAISCEDDLVWLRAA